MAHDGVQAKQRDKKPVTLPLLLTYSVPGTMLGTGNTAVVKMDMTSGPKELKC